MKIPWALMKVCEDSIYNDIWFNLQWHLIQFKITFDSIFNAIWFNLHWHLDQFTHLTNLQWHVIKFTMTFGLIWFDCNTWFNLQWHNVPTWTVLVWGDPSEIKVGWDFSLILGSARINGEVADAQKIERSHAN